MPIVLLLSFFAIAGYVGWHLWLLPPSLWLKWLLVATELLCIMLAVLALTRHLDRLPYGISVFVYNVGNKAMIVFLYLFLIFLLTDVLRMVHLVPPSWLKDNWLSLAILFLFLTALFVYARLNYEHKRRVEITIDTHGQLNHPVKLIAVSDLHLGYHNRRTDLDRWVAILNGEGADMLLMAGDLIDRSMRPLHAEDMAAGLRQLAMPVYACLGNHEYYADHYSPGEAEQFYADAGITLLRDTVATIDSIDLIGRDDRSNQRRKAIADFPIRQQAFSILLDHQPYHLEKAEQCGIDLQVSGHTHRGQVWPLSWITDVLYECSWGKHTRGTTTYYVSSGLGIWGAKYRIATHSEYIVIHLLP